MLTTPERWATRHGLAVHRGDSGALAVMDEAGTYRYFLARRWTAARPPLLLVMLNPSTADAEAEDATIRRCIARARRVGAGGVEVVNLFALRATDPGQLLTHPDPLGPAGNAALAWAAGRYRAAVAAWGAAGDGSALIRRRAADVALYLTAERDLQLRCLGLTRSGQPRHPLYVRTDAPFIPFETTEYRR